MEDAQIGFVKLLVAQYVSMYWPVLQGMQHVPVHQSPEVQTIQLPFSELHPLAVPEE